MKRYWKLGAVTVVALATLTWFAVAGINESKTYYITAAFIATGVIEAGCNTVIASRLKRLGMFWAVRGASAVVALRCCRHSRQSDDYWEDRRACQA